MVKIAETVLLLTIIKFYQFVYGRMGYSDGGEFEKTDTANLQILRSKRAYDPLDLLRSGSRSQLCVNVTSTFGLPKEDEGFAFGDAVVPGWAVFYRSERSIAFVKPKNVVPGHVLVMPLNYSKRIVDMPAEELMDMFLTAQHVQRGMERIHGVSSSLIAVQDGPDAGQSVNHVHVHIMPRRPKDFDENDEIYYKLQQIGKKLPLKWRTKEEMKAEAQGLRAFFSHQISI
ncbi:bis(5'-adenosyl)-triphosphatase-like [Paramacrobiotus metropolitanus]|uniref:bis(5'-adenosyl)-triphosphatase-like n=1 Tax=Paramacrobiotus metropolitanus TaxID=2943436 RepID=UPI002446495A|nr:bis(5'-adenosyl)-triphosphatase-like [Paramacrobiotus metropolitanus]